ncbi:CRN-like protein [Plasmopara halstedii]|uniref:CRN-like protein n=1 Tax=Plasmopara halstedii TaxID=4781 RepID=A0A0P1B1L1_PLAHL|nr:CRN-like protein [Plasmopara halstedii]CEG48632.1 CRN-like protein [Plasmopara halstedii]|eukprot:XP_024585001.1 CRN-like protein [Plasmopara halstedii]
MEGVDADRLELFLAKTEGGAWLDEAGVASVALDERGNPRNHVQMDPTLWIKNSMHFGDNFQPDEDQIHVLVVVPVDIGVTPSKLLRYKQQDTVAGSYMHNLSQFLLRLSVPSVLCSTGRIQPTKKDV